MPQIVVVTRDGAERHLNASTDLSGMQAIRDAGIYELLALCGGVCSCATCHVYVAEPFVNVLPRMSDDENELLDGSSHRTAASRLSCQLRLSQAPDGLRLTIAPEE
jgi:ferredoxin, 2Fe-2S